MTSVLKRNMATDTGKLILFASTMSQWSSVPILGLVEKEYKPHEYEIKAINLCKAENFSPAYLRVNKSATVPTMVTPSLSCALIESAEILEYLDQLHPTRGVRLAAPNAATETTAQKLIDLIHSDDLDTNLIILGARDEAEMRLVETRFSAYLGARQVALEQSRARYPLDKVFWSPKTAENGKLLRLCITRIGAEHYEYFESTHKWFRRFATAFQELESTLVLPWAAGEQVTYADLHIAPWLSHALYHAGAKSFADLGSLEKLVNRSEPQFQVGPKVQAWWAKMQTRRSFQMVFPVLH